MSKKIYLSLLLSTLFLFSTFSHGQNYIAEAVSNNFTYVSEISDEYEYLSETRKQTLDEALAEINREKPQQETKENETTSIIIKFVLSLLWVLFLLFAWTLGIIRAFLWIDNFFSSYVSKWLMFIIAWLLFRPNGILNGILAIIPTLIGIIKMFQYRVRKQYGQDESNISLWAEAHINDRIKLIYSYVIFSTLIMTQVAGLINVEMYNKYGFGIINNMPLSLINEIGTIYYLILILPPTLIRFVFFQRKLKYGLEICVHLAISLFTSLLVIFLTIGYLLPSFGLLATLSFYCILSYKSTDYSEMWHSYTFNPILFMLIALLFMTFVSRIITNNTRWYIPILEAIFACYVLTKHKNKTVSEPPHNELRQEVYISTGQEPRQEIHVNNNQNTRQSASDIPDNMIDIGLAHIGRKTAYDNQYLTPELTAERHNIEHTFIQALAQTFTDEKTRSGLSRHFMLYKELTLFIVFNMVLKKDKELHTKIQSKLKEHLSLGLSADTLKKRNDYWRKLSQKFHESYTRTHDMAGTLEYTFWSILPESIKSKGIFGRENLYNIFLYIYNAVEQEYKRYVKQVWGIK